MKKVFYILIMTLPLSAFAGFSSVTCVTDNKDIKIIMTNSDEPQIKFYTTSDSQPVIYNFPLNLMPDFKWNESADAITAIPFTDATYLSKFHQTLRITHKDGSWCNGRQRWDETSKQSFVLTAKDGEPLRQLAATTLGKYMTRDMYLITTLTCRNQGMTSSGGCYADEGDTATWADDKN